jgi:hypothetical protein
MCIYIYMTCSKLRVSCFEGVGGRLDGLNVNATTWVGKGREGEEREREERGGGKEEGRSDGRKEGRQP